MGCVCCKAAGLPPRTIKGIVKHCEQSGNLALTDYVELTEDDLINIFNSCSALLSQPERLFLPLGKASLASRATELCSNLKVAHLGVFVQEHEFDDLNHNMVAQVQLGCDSRSHARPLKLRFDDEVEDVTVSHAIAEFTQVFQNATKVHFVMSQSLLIKHGEANQAAFEKQCPHTGFLQLDGTLPDAAVRALEERCEQDYILNLSEFPHMSECQLVSLLHYTQPEFLFAPRISHADLAFWFDFATKARDVCPTLKVAHLGCLVNETEFAALRQSHADNQPIQLCVTHCFLEGRVLDAALEEFACVFPDSLDVSLLVSPGYLFKSGEATHANFKRCCPRARFLQLDGSASNVALSGAKVQYEEERIIDFSTCHEISECQLVSLLHYFPETKALFLSNNEHPQWSRLATKAKSVCPALKVAHLGCLVNLSRFCDLQSQYAARQVLSLTLPCPVKYGSDVTHWSSAILDEFIDAFRDAAEVHFVIPSDISPDVWEHNQDVFTKHCPRTKFMQFDTSFPIGAFEAAKDTYEQDRVLDFSSCPSIPSCQLISLLKYFPDAQFLFLPMGSNSASLAKTVCSTLKVVHLGCLINGIEFSNLQRSYANQQQLQLRLHDKISDAALEEFAGVFPEAVEVHFEMSPDALSKHGEANHAVFRKSFPRVRFLQLDGSVGDDVLSAAKEGYEQARAIDFSSCRQISECQLVSLMQFFSEAQMLFLPKCHVNSKSSCLASRAKDICSTLNVALLGCILDSSEFADLQQSYAVGGVLSIYLLQSGIIEDVLREFREVFPGARELHLSMADAVLSQDRILHQETFKRYCPQAKLLQLDGSIDYAAFNAAKERYEQDRVIDLSTCITLSECQLLSLLDYFPGTICLFLPRGPVTYFSCNLASAAHKAYPELKVVFLGALFSENQLMELGVNYIGKYGHGTHQASEHQARSKGAAHGVVAWGMGRATRISKPNRWLRVPLDVQLPPPALVELLNLVNDETKPIVCNCDDFAKETLALHHPKQRVANLRSSFPLDVLDAVEARYQTDGIVDVSSYEDVITEHDVMSILSVCPEAKQLLLPTGVLPMLDGLQVWLDASLACSVITGPNGNVDKWLDLSGRSNDAVAGVEPGPLCNGKINGFSAVSFSKGQLLKATRACQVKTVALVVQHRTLAEIAMLFNEQDQDFSIRVMPDGYRRGAHCDQNDFQDSEFQSHNLWINGSNTTGKWSGFPTAPVVVVCVKRNARADNRDFLYQLSSRLHNRGLDGSLGELLVYDDVLPAKKLQRLSLWLMRKWKIEIDDGGGFGWDTGGMATKARCLCPQMEVAHLGTILSEAEMKELKKRCCPGVPVLQADQGCHAYLKDNIILDSNLMTPTALIELAKMLSCSEPTHDVTVVIHCVGLRFWIDGGAASVAYFRENCKKLILVVRDRSLSSDLLSRINRSYGDSKSIDLSQWEAITHLGLLEILQQFDSPRQLFVPTSQRERPAIVATDMKQFRDLYPSLPLQAHLGSVLSEEECRMLQNQFIAIDMKQIKDLYPSLQVAHLGSVLSEEEFRMLQNQFVGGQPLVVPGRLTEGALHELGELFPQSSEFWVSTLDAITPDVLSRFKDKPRVVLLDENENNARKEAVPLQVREPAKFDAEAVSRLVIATDLPRELALLRDVVDGLETTECTFCHGSGFVASNPEAAEDDTADGQPILSRVVSRNSCALSRAMSRCSLGPPPMSRVLSGHLSDKLSAQQGKAAWFFETGGGGWDVYSKVMISALEEAWVENPGATVHLQNGTIEYLVDLSHMTQTNLSTGTIRRVIRVASGDDESIWESIQVRRLPCRFGIECTRLNGPKHAAHFCHPGDWDYPGNPQQGSSADYEKALPTWSFQKEDAVDSPWFFFDQAVSLHLEKLYTLLPITGSHIVKVRVPGGRDCKVDVGAMVLTDSDTGQQCKIQRVFDWDEDPNEPPNVIFSDGSAAPNQDVCPDPDMRKPSPRNDHEPPRLESKEPPRTESKEPPKTECWVCLGTGQMSKHLDAAALATASTADPPDCLVCFGEGQYCLSKECGKHFFCKDCLQGSLQGMLDVGQFPPFCPVCRAEAPHHTELTNGKIGEVELSFLRHRQVFESDFMFRFWKQVEQHEKGKDTKDVKYFACPAKCGRWLFEVHESYPREVGGLFYTKDQRPVVRLGKCPCGIFVCTRCFASERLAAAHRCPEAPAPVDDKAALALIAKEGGKTCPACGMAIQKAEGCDLMMCGTTAHGKVADALRNGGCAYIFSWSSLQPIHDGHGFTAMNGQWVRQGSPMDPQCTERRTLLKK